MQAPRRTDARWSTAEQGRRTRAGSRRPALAARHTARTHAQRLRWPRRTRCTAGRGPGRPRVEALASCRDADLPKRSRAKFVPATRSRPKRRGAAGSAAPALRQRSGSPSRWPPRKAMRAPRRLVHGQPPGPFRHPLEAPRARPPPIRGCPRDPSARTHRAPGRTRRKIADPSATIRHRTCTPRTRGLRRRARRTCRKTGERRSSTLHMKNSSRGDGNAGHPRSSSERSASRLPGAQPVQRAGARTRRSNLKPRCRPKGGGPRIPETVPSAPQPVSPQRHRRTPHVAAALHEPRPTHQARGTRARQASARSRRRRPPGMTSRPRFGRLTLRRWVAYRSSS